MLSKLLKVSLIGLTAWILFGCQSMSPQQSAAQQRASIQAMRSETLTKLYAIYPSAKAKVQSSAGYAVFSNVGVNVIFLSAEGGSGVAHDNKSGRDVYMRMVSGGVGLGLGVKDFRGVFVFSSPDKLNQFINSGWEANAQADAAAKADSKGAAYGGAVTVAPGIDLYQITENGLALQATIQGTKYFKNDDLNDR